MNVINLFINDIKSSSFRKWLSEITEIDSRALAAFRISAGFLIIADLFLRSRNFHLFYTNEGAVPISVAQEITREGTFSLFFLSGSPEFTAFLFLLNGLIALSLIIGYKSRFSILMSLIFVFSLDLRNPLVTSYADVIFRLMLFWAVFLPIGRRWSIDSVHSDNNGSDTVSGIAALMIQLQLIAMFFVNGIGKLYSDKWVSGDAAPLILGKDSMTFLLGDFLTSYPEILTVGGFLWMSMVLTSPLLLVLKNRLKMFFILVMVFNELFLAFTVRIGAFPWVTMAGLLVFLPVGFWNRIESFLSSRKFESGLSKIAGFFPQIEKYEKLKQTISQNSVFSIVVVAVLILLSVNLVFYNLGTILPAERNEIEIMDDFNEGMAIFGLEQPTWRIFLEKQNKTIDDYLVIVGTTSDNSTIDLSYGRNFTMERPPDITEGFPTYRYRFFYNKNNMLNQSISSEYLEFLCSRNDEMEFISTYYVKERVTMATLDNEKDRSRKIRLIHAWSCREGISKLVNKERNSTGIPEDVLNQIILSKNLGREFFYRLKYN
ncbi:MAG: HTTM domain-containing protein [Candidatus Nanohaloarchaea archaeon]